MNKYVNWVNIILKNVKILNVYIFVIEILEKKFFKVIFKNVKLLYNINLILSNLLDLVSEFNVNMNIVSIFLLFFK